MSKSKHSWIEYPDGTYSVIINGDDDEVDEEEGEDENGSISSDECADYFNHDTDNEDSFGDDEDLKE